MGWLKNNWVRLIFLEGERLALTFLILIDLWKRLFCNSDLISGLELLELQGIVHRNLKIHSMEGWVKCRTPQNTFGVSASPVNLYLTRNHVIYLVFLASKSTTRSNDANVHPAWALGREIVLFSVVFVRLKKRSHLPLKLQQCFLNPSTGTVVSREWVNLYFSVNYSFKAFTESVKLEPKHKLLVRGRCYSFLPSSSLFGCAALSALDTVLSTPRVIGRRKVLVWFRTSCLFATPSVHSQCHI